MIRYQKAIFLLFEAHVLLYPTYLQNYLSLREKLSGIKMKNGQNLGVPRRPLKPGKQYFK